MSVDFSEHNNMKKLIVLSLVSGLTVGCTSTRIDDHSYHHNDVPVARQAPPVNIVNNYISNPPQVKSVNHYNYEIPRPPVLPPLPRVYQEDEEFLQYQQGPQLTPASYRGLHIRADMRGHRTVVPASWDFPQRGPAIPSGNAGIPVFYRY